MLEKAYLILDTTTCGKTVAYCLENRRHPGRYHLAYRTVSMTRYKITGPLAHDAIKSLLAVLRHDYRSGRSHVSFVHRARTLHRETAKIRFKKHRLLMAKRREESAIVSLPTFGMF